MELQPVDKLDRELSFSEAARRLFLIHLLGFNPPNRFYSPGFGEESFNMSGNPGAIDRLIGVSSNSIYSGGLALLRRCDLVLCIGVVGRSE